uniref:Uncharacterized protein n=1 Tax=Anguilla anguilla TaxID=7936 RepID=A0A0E9STC7_ANGAN
MPIQSSSYSLSASWVLSSVAVQQGPVLHANRRGRSTLFRGGGITAVLHCRVRRSLPFCSETVSSLARSYFLLAAFGCLELVCKTESSWCTLCQTPVGALSVFLG